MNKNEKNSNVNIEFINSITQDEFNKLPMLQKISMLCDKYFMKNFIYHIIGYVGFFIGLNIGFYIITQLCNIKFNSLNFNIIIFACIILFNVCVYVISKFVSKYNIFNYKDTINNIRMK